MKTFIHDSPLKLINFFLLLAIFIGCNDASSKFQNYEQGEIILPSGEKIKTYVAVTYKQQKQGLSGLMPDQFGDSEGMIFLDPKDSVRQFWMPDTHFNLDIIFLNKDLYVLDIHKNLQHFPKKEPKSEIPLSKKVYCRYVLEVKADGPLSKKIEPGMMLKWNGKQSLSQIISNTHP